METEKEIKSLVVNMEYYVNQIIKLTNKQFNLDMENYRLGEKMDRDVNVGSVRFNSIAAINLDCVNIKTYFENIKRNVDAIVKNEKEIKKEENEI